MNELEKCMAGKWYDCHDEIFLEYKNTARRLLAQYNDLAYDQKKRKNSNSKRAVWKYGEQRIGWNPIHM